MVTSSRIITSFAVFAAPIQALNILMVNDDSWGSANIRETYRLLREAGHDAWMVAPANAQSGASGTFQLATSSTLGKPSTWDLLPAGAPSIGHAANDSHMWYYDGSPLACTIVGLDYVIPTFASFSTPDLVVSGPNFGNNLGTAAFTGSGTIAATYIAVMRSIPAIAFSAANAPLSYTDIENQPDADATKYARLTIELIERVANRTSDSSILPLGYGLDVNFPALNVSCADPAIVFSRFTGGAGMLQVEYNESTQLLGVTNNGDFSSWPEGMNTCLNGDCSREGESIVVQSCKTAVTVYTVDHDAPDTPLTESVVAKFVN